MSTKVSKRRQKRLNTNDEEADIEKIKKDDKLEQNGDNIIDVDSNTDKSEPSEPHIDENGGASDLKGFSPSEITSNESSENMEEPQVDIVVETVESMVLDCESSKTTKEESESEMEPLTLDAEDPELQFPEEASDVSDHDKSPIINRCQTRRGQIVCIPTPQTPLVQNGDPTPETEHEIIIEESDDEDEKNATMHSAEDNSEIEDDLENASHVANYTGNDTTRNEVTLTEDNDAKERSYSDTIRSLTGRRTLRGEHSLRLNKDSVRYSPMRVSPLKRKFANDGAEQTKRFKEDETSAGLLSYISSPIHSFRNKLGRNEVSSSTPKLTAFKYTHRSTAVDELNKPDDNEAQIEPKKWCAIM